MVQAEPQSGLKRLKAMAAPATVSGECCSIMPLTEQTLGRPSSAVIRKPGDLPVRRHPSCARGVRGSGRYSVVVTILMRFVWRVVVNSSKLANICRAAQAIGLRASLHSTVSITPRRRLVQCYHPYSNIGAGPG